MREFALGLLECSAMASVSILTALALRAALARKLPPAAMLALWALALARLLLPVALPSPVHVDSLIPRPAAVQVATTPNPQPVRNVAAMALGDAASQALPAMQQFSAPAVSSISQRI